MKCNCSFIFTSKIEGLLNPLTNLSENLSIYFNFSRFNHLVPYLANSRTGSQTHFDGFSPVALLLTSYIYLLH